MTAKPEIRTGRAYDVSRTDRWEALATIQRIPHNDAYAYRAFGRFGWLARLRAYFGVWRHLHHWPEPARSSLVHRILAGKRHR